MKSSLPKVLHTVGGQPMIQHVLQTATSLEPEAIHVVFNPDTPEVRQACSAFNVEWVPQAQRLGTGHAVQQAVPRVPADARVLVLYGDIPLLRARTLRRLLEREQALSVLTMKLQDPTGYGRIVRDAEGHVTGIVEERDANAEERAICEVNSGIVLAERDRLEHWLEQLETGNSQGEYYLTDIFGLASAESVPIGSVVAENAGELSGANDRVQMAMLERRFQQAEAERLMLAGVRIVDPARIDVRGNVRAGRDVSIDINVVLEGTIDLGEGVVIGPGCVLRDCSLAAGTTVYPFSVLEGVITHGACSIGPFARLRPGTELGVGAKVGNFVETKKARLGNDTKASHLSYLGDAEIGDGVNIGAGTITCNYDGVNKHKTIIEDDVFIGSDTQLVAPVTIGQGADIGAGSTITRDVPAGKLTLSRVKQVTVPHWKRPVKKG
jgi:bifunctional UDP-N-acetylglucosamine pyrophosphorylase/glucosamine-1-phosphate N-acetyltransferase